MTKVMVTEEYLENTGDAIREKNGSSDLYTPAQFASAIRAIPTAEVDSKTITANGTYNASSDNLDGYDTVTVNVPNSYSSSDEGKVVSSGALVAQTSTTKNANGTYDTTTNNSVTVNVANSYTASDEGKVVSSGALVAQTSKSIDANGTYDTTTNSSVVVDVPTGGGSTLGTKTITQNGTYNASSDSLDGYSQVTVNVPSGINWDDYDILKNAQWEQGAVSGNTNVTYSANKTSSTTRIRLTNLLPVTTDGVYYIKIAEGYDASFSKYNVSEICTNPLVAYGTYDNALLTIDSPYIAFVIRKSNDATITVDDLTSAKVAIYDVALVMSDSQSA